MVDSYYNNTVSGFNWSKQNIKWYLDAENTTTFYNTGAEIMRPYMKNSGTILDIGCGIGSFSMEFAKRGFNVTAIDKSSLAVNTLIKRARMASLRNLKALNISFENFHIDQKYDIILISYMMGLVNSENIDRILEYTNKHLILVLPADDIKKDFSIYEFYSEAGIDVNILKQSNYLNVLEVLNKKNILYETNVFKSDFGQPFETIEDAVNFTNYYFNITWERWDKLRSWLSRKLIIRNKLYYLPNIKESVMIVI